MTELEFVNPVALADAEPWLRTLATTFLGNPYDDDFAERVRRWTMEWLPERTWGIRAGSRWVATLATEPRTMTVPGRGGTTVDVEVDALTGVTVAATHRRRGLLNQMIGSSLALAKEIGHPFSILIAAEWPIYGRYGYAPATWHANYVHSPRAVGGAVLGSGAGELRQVDPSEIAEYAPGIFDAARRRRAGQVDRRNFWWDKRVGQDPFHVIGRSPHWFVHEGPGGPDGVLAWRPTRDFELDGSLGAIEVNELFATNDDAYRDLWAYLTGIDVISEITLHGFATDEPARWLLGDARTLRETYRGDDTWVRLLDIPAALSLRGYAGDGSIVLDVVDEDPGGYARGRVRLDVADGVGVCEPSADEADLRLTHRALASPYLGATSLRQLAVGGGVEELTAGAMARFDAMFATALAPWNATGF